MTETALPQGHRFLAADRPALVARDGRALYYSAKRAIDIILAIVALVIVAPLMLFIAVLIKLDSPGPVFFAQARVGSRRCRDRWNLCTFYVYKFRSMVHDADPSIHEAHISKFVRGRLSKTGANGARFKIQHDPRVTRVGALLRRTSLDELPQLMNVLRGEMSLVGPRPVPPYEVSHYDLVHFGRFRALPGITGLWQVSGRCSISFNEMVRLDLEYVKTQSLALDCKILLRTVPAVVTGRGAG
jgi:lipopolysaccharide/colanic/teichoic acid biosynthesis glycosyltransferase